MDRPTLRQFEYAVAVEETRSFSRAAAECHVSQPGLSAQIAELERRLGAVLFERGRTVTTPTVVGGVVLARARQILRDVDDLIRATDAHRDAVVGVLRVAAIPTIAPYLLAVVARRLRQVWPEVQLELSELRTSELVEAMGAGRLDIAVLATPVDTGSLAVVDLAFEPFVVAVSEASEWASRPTLGIDELGATEILLLEDGHCLREHALAVCHLAGLANHRDIHHTGLAVLAQMVASSDAATLLPASAVPVEARPGSGLVAIPLRGGDVGRTLSMVWRRTDPRAELYASSVPSIAGAVRDALAP